MMGELNRPVIVLVRPQAGRKHRARPRVRLLNFGLTEMRAGRLRAMAGPTLRPALRRQGPIGFSNSAKVYATTAEGGRLIAPIVHATTVGKRGVTKPVIGADESRAAGA